MHQLTLDLLLALEHKGWEALCNRTGGSFYGELMTEDALMVLVNGIIVDRDTVVASLNEAPTWDSYELRDPQVVVMSAQCAALVYRATAQRGNEPPFEALMSSTYVMVDDKPRLGLYQQTTITH